MEQEPRKTSAWSHLSHTPFSGILLASFPNFWLGITWKPPDPTYLPRCGIKYSLDMNVPHSSRCFRNDLSTKQMLLEGFQFVFLLEITDHDAGGESEPWDSTGFLRKSDFLCTLAGSCLGNGIPVQIPGCEHPGGSRIIQCIPEHPRETRELIQGSAGSHTPVPVSLLLSSRAIYPKCHFYLSPATGWEAENFHMDSNRKNIPKLPGMHQLPTCCWSWSDPGFGFGWSSHKIHAQNVGNIPCAVEQDAGFSGIWDA